MGRKTNPIILRISSISRSWDGKWFADRRIDYRKNLLADISIREYFKTRHRTTSISRIEIERHQLDTILTIHTSRPAVVIGRGGSGIEQIQKELKKILRLKGSLKINVQEILNPDTDAAAVATQAVEQIERRFPFRRVLKQSVSRAMQAGAKGAKILVAGRLNGAEIARKEWLAEGSVPLHTYRADISYACQTAHTSYGTIGVKVWINRGDLVTVEEEEEQKRPHKQSVRHQSSLARAAREGAKVKTAKK